MILKNKQADIKLVNTGVIPFEVEFHGIETVQVSDEVGQYLLDTMPHMVEEAAPGEEITTKTARIPQKKLKASTSFQEA